MKTLLSDLNEAENSLLSKSQSINESQNSEDLNTAEISNAGEVECPHCDYTCSTKKGKGHQMHRHIRSEHGGRAALTYRSSKVEGLHTHQCKTCKIWFTGPVRSDRHQCAEYRKFYEKYILKNDEGKGSAGQDTLQVDGSVRVSLMKVMSVKTRTAMTIQKLEKSQHHSGQRDRKL